jgi:hypothetical protein
MLLDRYFDSQLLSAKVTDLTATTASVGRHHRLKAKKPSGRTEVFRASGLFVERPAGAEFAPGDPPVRGLP